jgi:hypothetical protein
MKMAVGVALVSVAFVLAAHVGAQDEPPFLGDADCSDAVSSIDAAVTLQYDATLSASVPCPESADASVDDRITAIDATLMLQMSAGLIAGIVHESLAVEPASACDVEMSACTFDAGSEFHVSVVLSSLPRVGYVGLQTLYNGRLDYRLADTAQEEVLWPDGAFFVRLPENGPNALLTGTIAQGAATAVVPPYPDSRYNGPLVSVKLACPEEPGVYPLVLGSYEPGHTLGSGVLGLTASGQSFQPMIYQSQIIGRMDIDANLDGFIGGDERDLPISDTLTITCV